MGYPRPLVNWEIPDYGAGMSKRSDAQRRAEKAYDAEREDKPISARFSVAEMALIDQARGTASRAAWIKALALRELKINAPVNSNVTTSKNPRRATKTT